MSIIDSHLFLVIVCLQTVIKEMNRLGMIVDLSHSSHKTSIDTIEASEAPVIFSHSSASALCNSTRNVKDDILKMVVSELLIVLPPFEIIDTTH